MLTNLCFPDESIFVVLVARHNMQLCISKENAPSSRHCQKLLYLHTVRS